MSTWKPSRPLAPGEMRSGLLLVGIGLGASYLLAGFVALPAITATLLYLAAMLGLAGIGAPDWLSQVLRRVPSRGAGAYDDIAARAFLISSALGALAFGAWTALR